MIKHTRKIITFILTIILLSQICIVAMADEGTQPLGYIVKVYEDRLDDADIDILDYLEPIPYARGFYTAETAEDLVWLIEAGLIEYIEENVQISLPEPEEPIASVFSTTTYDYTGHYDLIQMQSAWDMNLYGDGVTIAIIDSGIYAEHDEFTNLDLSELSTSFVSGSDSIVDGTGHGSFVTGVVAADHDSDEGLNGGAPEATIMVLRVFDSSGNTTTAAVLSAIEYAIENGVQVINMSLGGMGSDFKNSISEAIGDAYDAGILMVAAVGNYGTGAFYYPANFDEVLGVGMVYSDGTIASNSQRNTSVFVVAPGKEMVGIDYNGGYKVSSGTSYASPVIASFAAMAKQVAPNITMDGFFELIQISADDRGADGYDTAYGYGLINATTFTENLTGENSIAYTLDGGTNPIDAQTSYIVGRGETVVTLPVPTRTGYIFRGWYESSDFGGEALGETLSFDETGDLELYALWELDESLGVYSIAVRDFEAVASEDATEYSVTLPSDMTDISADDFVITMTNENADISEIIYSDGKLTFTISYEENSLTYSVSVIYSENSIPIALCETILGTATPTSLDGLTVAVPYTADVSEWFSGDITQYSVLGDTAAIIEGSVLTFTAIGDEENSDISFEVFAKNDSFISEAVAVTISVSALPSSTAVADTSDISFTIDHSEDLEIGVRAYGNELKSATLSAEVLARNIDYKYSGDISTQGDSEAVFTLYAETLNELSPAIYNLLLDFGDGGECNVSITTAKYSCTITFYNGENVYHTVAVCEGEELTLPSGTPVKSGYSFLGWFDATVDGVQYTDKSVINSDLTLYAVFEITESTTGGTTGGGGGGSSSSSDDEEEEEVEMQDETLAIENWENPFDDVEAGAWYYEAVASMNISGLVLGTSDTTFEPDTGVARAQLWTLLARISGESVADYDEAMLWAVENEISDGSTPEKVLSREQLVTTLWRMANSPEEQADLPDEFCDATEISDYAIEAFKWAYANEILQGASDTTLMPKGEVTRAQIVVILTRITGFI